MLTTPFIAPENRFTHNQDIQTYTFKKENGRWFVHLPDRLGIGWQKSDLEMVEGAHKLLNTVANGRHKVTLRMSTTPFAGADVLQLIEHCAAPKGGAFYLMPSCQGRRINALIWICDIALFVFGDMPDYIYVQRACKRPSMEPQQLQ